MQLEKNYSFRNMWRRAGCRDSAGRVDVSGQISGYA